MFELEFVLGRSGRMVTELCLEDDGLIVDLSDLLGDHRDLPLAARLVGGYRPHVSPQLCELLARLEDRRLEAIALLVQLNLGLLASLLEEQSDRRLCLPRPAQIVGQLGHSALRGRGLHIAQPKDHFERGLPAPFEDGVVMPDHGAVDLRLRQVAVSIHVKERQVVNTRPRPA